MSTRFEVVVSGPCSPVLLDVFDGFEQQPEASGRTRLVGTLPDDAALHGALQRLADLRVELIGVRRLDPGEV